MKLTIQSIEYKIIDVDKSIMGSIFDNVYWFHVRGICTGKFVMGKQTTIKTPATVEIGDTIKVDDTDVRISDKFALEALRHRIETELLLDAALPGENG